MVGAHTAMPLGRMKIAEFAKDADKGDREFVMIVNETFREECAEARQMVWFVDTTVEKKPMVVSHWTVPEASGNFCTRGGRFGAHSSNEDQGPPYFGKLTFITFFNAGRARARHPQSVPAEGGRLLHSADHRSDGGALQAWSTASRCCSNTVIQSNNAETDDRGYVYVADRSNTGLHILELTGEARAIAGLPPLK